MTPFTARFSSPSCRPSILLWPLSCTPAVSGSPSRQPFSSPLPLSGPPSMRTKVPWRVSLCKVSIFLDPTMLLKTTGKQHYFKARGRCQGNKGLSIWDPSEMKCRQVGRYSRWSEAELERQTQRDTVSLIWDQSLESTMEIVLWSPHMLGHHTPTDLKHT